MVKILAIKEPLNSKMINDRNLAWSVASSVLDPEIPCVTIGELGIIRDLKLHDRKATISVSPTYSGCPAVLAIELAIQAALLKAGFEPTIKRVLSPPWTTDWISESGREKLKDYGITPPVNASSKMALFGKIDVKCPRCSSQNTEKLSEFGSTACKAQYRCNNCFEPFDYFKCI
jgi:ring-1,2-phenylacetyl-CoA epoxidase subunit PaaD